MPDSPHKNSRNLLITGFLTVALILTAFTVTQVRSLETEAAKGGKGKGGGGGKPSTCCSVTMTVSPNPVPAGGAKYIISGTGFAAGAGVNFVLNGVATFVRADDTGYAATTYTSWNSGTYTAYAKEYIGRGYETVGMITFQVVD